MRYTYYQGFVDFRRQLQACSMGFGVLMLITRSSRPSSCRSPKRFASIPLMASREFRADALSEFVLKTTKPTHEHQAGRRNRSTCTSMESYVLCLVDNTHPTTTELFYDSVM